MTAHAERGPLTVDPPAEGGVRVLRDADRVTTALVMIDPRNPDASVILAHQLAAAPLLFEALEKAQAVEDHELECDFCLNAPFCEIRGQMAIAAGVAREDALMAARVPDEREVD